MNIDGKVENFMRTGIYRKESNRNSRTEKYSN